MAHVEIWGNTAIEGGRAGAVESERRKNDTGVAKDGELPGRCGRENSAEDDR